MMWVRERRPEQRIQAQAKAQKEEKLGRVKQGCKASRNGAKERTKRSGIAALRCHLIFHVFSERHPSQKSASALFAFFQQILVYVGDLLQQRLNLSKAADPLLDLLLQVGGNGDLPYPPRNLEPERPHRSSGRTSRLTHL